MDVSEISKLENHEYLNLTLKLSSSGYLQLLRTTMKPELATAVVELYAEARNLDAPELMMRGMEIQSEATLAGYGLLELFRRTQDFDGYSEARESCKQALKRLRMNKSAQRLFQLTPGTPDFDREYFFFDFVPGNYEEALRFHQGTIADAAGRGDLVFFKRLYDRVRNEPENKAGGQYPYFLTTIWLHGFLWLMPEKLACEEVAGRMRRLFEAGEKARLESRKHESDRKQEYETKVSAYEKLKAGEKVWHEWEPQSAEGPQHEKERNRLRKAVKNLGLYQHPESPVVGTRKPSPGEPSSVCYIWKEGWPK